MARVFVTLLAIGAVYMVVTSVPDIVRYIKIRGM